MTSRFLSYRRFMLVGLSVAITAHVNLPIEAQTQETLDSPALELAQAQSVSVKAVADIGMTVSDMDRSVAFYQDVLSFQKISAVEVFGAEYEQLQGVFGVRMRVVRMQLGQEVIELTEYLTPKGKPIPIDSRSNDLWFQHIAIVVRDMDTAYQHLRKHNVQHVSTGPQRLPETIPAAAGIEAFYFQDPDGHNLEVIFFPPGKGDPRWQQPTQSLFLGIDHTAIAISDTNTSLQFYQDILGLKLVGQSENFGAEQEHLNNVFGAKLLISGLKASSGPGIEFLHYLTPATGRSRPANAQANDLLHWQTTIVVDDANATAKRLKAKGVTFVSTDVVTLPKKTLSFKKGFLIKDPNGHVLRIIEP